MITVRRGRSHIGRIFIEGRKSDGTCRGVRYDLAGERRLRSELRAAVERNAEGIALDLEGAGEVRPRNLGVWTRGAILAIQAVAERTGLDLEAEGIDEWGE